MSGSSFVDDYLPALLAQASELVSGEFHAIVREHGFTVLEWRVLATLANGETLSVGELARIVMAKQPTVTRLLDRMQARGHLARIAHGTDRRVTLVRASASGRRTVAGLIALAREHEHRVLVPLGIEVSGALKQSLRTMIERSRSANGSMNGSVHGSATGAAPAKGTAKGTATGTRAALEPGADAPTLRARQRRTPRRRSGLAPP